MCPPPPRMMLCGGCRVLLDPRTLQDGCVCPGKERCPQRDPDVPEP